MTDHILWPLVGVFFGAAFVFFVMKFVDWCMAELDRQAKYQREYMRKKRKEKDK